MPDRPVCPMCGEFGIHPTVQDCLDELRAERDRLRQQMQPWEPSVKYLRYYYAAFYP